MRQVVDRMHMSEVSICYGMTETSPVSTQTRVDDPLELRVTTVGQVGPHLEIKIVAPGTGGETLGRNETGELCTRGYSVMTGYWNDPEKTAEAIDADGWMHTGDLAEMDDAGYVRITGRIKDMVIRGGENIYPREIEEFLYTHPDILDARSSVSRTRSTGGRNSWRGSDSATTQPISPRRTCAPSPTARSPGTRSRDTSTWSRNSPP